MQPADPQWRNNFQVAEGIWWANSMGAPWLCTAIAECWSGGEAWAGLLRSDAPGALAGARQPGWDGTAADHCKHHAGRRETQVAAVAGADQTIADVVAAQADVVWQARGALEAILAGLTVSIGVAVTWEDQIRVMQAAAPGAALAWEAALAVFGTAVAAAAIGGVVQTLMAMDDAGTTSASSGRQNRRPAVAAPVGAAQQGVAVQRPLQVAQI